MYLYSMYIDEAVEKLAEHLSKEMNIMKVIEECAELQEVMIKYLTKGEAFKPKMDKITEEMGDVMFRIMVAIYVLGVEKEVEKRIEDKAKHLYEWAVDKFEKQI